MWTSSLREKIIQDFKQARARNSRFSLRSYAKRLELSLGLTSEILSGKRVITAKTASKILPRLTVLTAEERQQFLEQMEKDRDRTVCLQERDHDILTDWRYLAVLTALEREVPTHSLESTAEIVGISQPTCQKILLRLQNLGLVTASDNGHYRTTGLYVTTADNVPNQFWRQAHQKQLDLAKQALERYPTPERDFVSLTFCGDARQIEAARRMTRRYLERLSALMKSTHNDTVYRLSVQLHPFAGFEE